MSCTASECPTSLITVESIQLLDDFGKARSAHRTFGASPYGGNSDRWPGYLQDTAVVLSQAENDADRIESGY